MVDPEGPRADAALRAPRAPRAPRPRFFFGPRAARAAGCGRSPRRGPRWARPGRPRLALLAGLLGVALALVGVLTYQAQSAARSQRGVAERALHDYASFAMWQLERETTREMLAAIVVSFYSQQLRVDPELPEKWPAVGDLKETLDRLRTNVSAPYLEGVTYYFRLDWRDSALTTAGGEPTAEEVAWLRRAVYNAPSAVGDSTEMRPYMWGPAEPRARGLLNVIFSNDTYGLAFARIGGRPRLLAFATARDARDGSPLVVYGYQADAERFVAPILGRVLEKSPLLPPSLVGDLPTDSILSVHAHDPTGNQVFHSGAWATETAYAVADTLDPRFGGLVLDLALRPEMASRLVVGGLPRSRLPLLLGLLALTSALVGVALIQIRRQEELARLRTDFVSGVSHELRTPLAQIRLFAELLRKEQIPTASERARSAEIIDEEAQRLSYLVENVLSFSRAEHGAQGVAAQPLELAAEVRGAVEAFAPLARARRASLRASVPAGLVVVADPRALRQVLFNLFDNAAKYAPPGRAVTVGAARPGDGERGTGGAYGGAGAFGAARAVRLWVDDEGPGIPAAERDRVWQPYYRMPRDSETAVGGSGIGLAVVRELVELQGGRAWIDEAPSGGARFVVELPGADVDEDWPSPEEYGATMGVTAEHAAHVAAEAATHAATHAAVTAAANATVDEG